MAYHKRVWVDCNKVELLAIMNPFTKAPFITWTKL